MWKHAQVGESGARTGRAGLVISILMLLLLLGSAVTSQAQVLYGSLTGTVTDTSGAVVAGAKIDALNIATGVVRSTVSDDAGIYRIPALQPGTYKVTIAAPKFVTAVTDNVPVLVNNVQRVDASLKIQSSSSEVTVTTEAPLLQTDKSDVHTDLSSNQISSLPITSSVGGRNFQSLLRIVPGFGNLTEQNSAGANPSRSMSTNVNGQDLQTTNTRIDGAQDAYPWLPGNVAYVPPADAIETVNVVTNSFDPEQGMAGGAAVNVQIKSGTNQFHGSAHEFHNDQSLRARNYFQTDPTRFPTKSRENKNQFGGTIGGPIKKDKLFFFGDFERTTQRQLARGTAALPSEAMKGGDFSSLLPAGYDCNAAAAGTQPNPTAGPRAGCIWDPVNNIYFAGNKIPTNRIDPAAAKMMSVLPVATTQPSALGSLAGDYVTRGTGELNRNNADIKVNWVPTQKSTLFGRYSISTSSIFDPPSLGAAGGDATAGGQLGNSNGRVQSVGVGGTYAFSSTLVGDWNAGFTRQRLGATALDITSAYGLDTLGISGTNGAGTVGDPSLYNGIPAFQIATTSNQSASQNLGNPNTGNPFLFRDNQYVWGANLSWTKSKHAFRFGFEYNHTQVNHFQPQGSDGTFTTPRGSFEFNGQLTSHGQCSAAITGGGTTPSCFPEASFAQLLLGLPNRAGKAIYSFNPNALRWTQYAWYARDQFQVTPDLTLTLGVRWEYYPFGYADNGRGLPIFDPTNGNVYIGGFGGVPLDSGVDTHSGSFLPRIGIAYRLSDKTVLRAGYGMSLDPNNYRFLRNAYPATITSDNGTNAAGTPITSLTGTNAAAVTGGTTGLASLLLPVPNISTGVIALPDKAGTRTYPKDFRRGYIQSFNVTLQQEFKGFVGEAGYVGARGIRPLTGVNYNTAQICPASVQSGPTTDGYKTQCNAAGYGRILNYPYNTTTNTFAHNWADISSQVPYGNNYYDSLQTKLTRRLGSGSQVGLVYTFSKTINFAENSDLSGLFIQDPKYAQLNRSLAGFDRPHNLQVYMVYDLPFGKGKRWMTDGPQSYILGGWQMNTVVSRLSGTPFTVTSSSSLLNPAVSSGLSETGNQIGTYSVIAGRPKSTVGNCASLSCEYFDPTAFAAPAPGTIGNTRRNQFRGPGIFNWDLSVFRNFKLTERFTFQFRSEFFSLTNTPRFNNPNTTVGALGSGFGAITATNGVSGSNSSTDGARNIWFAGKLIF